jgi:hypothetical protein
MKEQDKQFYRGFGAAVGTLARNGWPSQAADIMQTNGVTFKQLKESGVEEFDLKPLRTECSLLMRKKS